MAKLFVSSVLVLTLAIAYTRCDELRTNESAEVKMNLSKFKCLTSNEEIEVYKRGDGNMDCEDSSDEDFNRNGNHTILYFVWRDVDTKRDYLKGVYVNSSAKGEFQLEIPVCSTSNWKILYAHQSHVHLHCYDDFKYQIMSISRDGWSRTFHNFTLRHGHINDLLGFSTNSSTGKPIVYFKHSYKNPATTATITFIKICSENDRNVEDCPKLKYDRAKKPEHLVFSPKNNGTLFWVDNQAVVKYSMNTSSASNIGPELKQPNHLTKDAATNRLYVQVLYDGSNEWIQSFNFNGEQLNRIRKVEDEEKNQFAVHNDILYWFRETDSVVSYCNASRGNCDEKSQKSLDLHVNATNELHKITSIYVYDYQTNLEENLPPNPLPTKSNNTLLIYCIIGGCAITLLFIALAYVMGKKKGERTQSMDIHDDILTGTLRRKPAYCNEESLLTKGNDASTEKSDS